MDQFTPERRKTARHRVLQGGSISFHHLGAKIDCTVRNLSEAGACLVVTSPFGIPNEFDLVLDREKYAATLPCYLAQREQDRR
jgi:hypothetical protein